MAVFLVLPLPVDVGEMQRVLTIAAHPAPRLQTLKPILQFRVIVVMRASRRGGEINSDEGSEEFHAVCVFVTATTRVAAAKNGKVSK
jgi:hypothetical protein